MDSDGWLGDTRHQGLKSDHNPDDEGMVLALDITLRGIEPLRLVVDVSHHPAIWYVIVRGFIYSARNDFIGVPYTGSDPHVKHAHINLRHSAAAIHSKRSWLSA